MTLYTIQFSVYEGGEHIVEKDTYVADTADLAILACREDYPGCDEYRVIREQADVDRFDRALALADSGTRGGVLLAACEQATPGEARTLLAEWFTVCDALAPWRDGLIAQFRRAGFVTDTDDTLHMPCVVYRAAWADDNPLTGMSWTTEREQAERFARYLTGPRAWFLGIRRDDVDPVIWQATCGEALGYLTGRDENEVIPDPGHLTDVEVIQVLTTVKDAE